MSHNPTKHLVRVGVNGASRAGVFLGLFRVILVLMSIRKDRKLQQIVVTAARSVTAVARGLVTVTFTEGD